MAVLVRRAIRLRGQFAYSRADFARAVELLAEGRPRPRLALRCAAGRGRRGLCRTWSTAPPSTPRCCSRPHERASLSRHRRARLHRRVGGRTSSSRTGEEVVTFDLSTDPRRLALLLPTGRLEAVPHVVGDISDLDTVERALDEHGITNVIHLAALQVPFVPRRPAARRARERARDGERLRGRAAPARPDGADRLRLVDRRVRRARRRRAARDERPPGNDLRRLQARQRVDRVGLPRRERRAERGPAPAHGLRRRPRPGPHLGADDGDARRRGRRCPTRFPTAARASSSSRATSRGRSSRRALSGIERRDRAHPARPARERAAR